MKSREAIGYILLFIIAFFSMVIDKNVVFPYSLISAVIYFILIILSIKLIGRI